MLLVLLLMALLVLLVLLVLLLMVLLAGSCSRDLCFPPFWHVLLADALRHRGAGRRTSASNADVIM